VDEKKLIINKDNSPGEIGIYIQTLRIDLDKKKPVIISNVQALQTFMHTVEYSGAFQDEAKDNMYAIMIANPVITTNWMLAAYAPSKPTTLPAAGEIKMLQNYLKELANDDQEKRDTAENNLTDYLNGNETWSNYLNWLFLTSNNKDADMQMHLFNVFNAINQPFGGGTFSNNNFGCLMKNVVQKLPRANQKELKKAFASEILLPDLKQIITEQYSQWLKDN
jgi:hypothetical protein